MEKIIHIEIKNGYAGAISIKARTEAGRVLVLEREEAERIIKEHINARGFTAERGERQQYERLIAI